MWCNKDIKGAVMMIEDTDKWRRFMAAELVDRRKKEGRTCCATVFKSFVVFLQCFFLQFVCLC